MFIPLLQHLMFWLIKSAFIREFGSVDEATVVSHLTHKRDSLQEAFRAKDDTRREIDCVRAMLPAEGRKTLQSYWDSRMYEAHQRVRSELKRLDYALGLAYLMGFGKVI